MSDPAGTGLAALEKLASEMINLVAKEEVEAMRAVQAEMDVFLKGAPKPVTPQTEAEVEAGFDNLPV